MSVDQFMLVEIRAGLRVLWRITGGGFCRSCARPIVWCMTTSGTRHPVDEPATPGAATVSHFATCPDAGKWRTR